jgi:hypothetical protein
MDGASHSREQANHIRRLAELTWQDDLEVMLRGLAQAYDEIADDLEAPCPASLQRVTAEAKLKAKTMPEPQQGAQRIL